MGLLTVESHEYDEAKGVDSYVFNPGAMKAQVKIIEKDNGEPEVLLGVQGMAVQIADTEPTWTVCRNKDIVEIALADWKARQA